MRTLFTLLICTISMFAETYISNSIISNSVIVNSNMGKKGSGVIVSKTITPKSLFDRIYIDVTADIELRYSSNSSIEIKTDDNLIDNIIVYVKDKTLFIKIDKSINPTKGLKINIDSGLLKELNIDGASDIVVKNYHLDNFRVNINGALDILFNSNSFKNLFLNADGSYDINLLNSRVKNAYIEADGSGNIKINVTDYMDISVDGTAEVEYMGNPKIKKSIEGVAQLTKI